MVVFSVDSNSRRQLFSWAPSLLSLPPPPSPPLLQQFNLQGANLKHKLRRDLVCLSGCGQHIGGFSESDNSRESTHRPHSSREALRTKKRFDSLIERRTGQLYKMHHVRNHPLIPPENQDILFPYSKIMTKQVIFRAFKRRFLVLSYV